MSIIERFKRLELPATQCVVIGSGILDALGLRASRDIDLVVQPNLFAMLQISPDWHTGTAHGETVLEKDDVEVWQSWGSDGVPNFEELYVGSVEVDGIHFANPQFVLAWKRKRRRGKDIEDIRLLEEYLRHER